MVVVVVMVMEAEEVEVNLIGSKDSGCSNHMTRMKSMFKELDETQKMQVKLRNGKEIQVEGKDTMAIETSHGEISIKQSGQTLINVNMTQNKMFPLEVSNVGIFFLLLVEKMT
ncbi:hypothetical protein Patl1_34712 [Pistacia atlantica]|uniref:Uncharacterized protein n=1 Tax=Pistacia atlantica TaxID=434234 RepID=A0ACC0ZXS6_9ROSI|nr:hypothetical protein Patl1_34712 [Pistacia atlantica]